MRCDAPLHVFCMMVQLDNHISCSHTPPHAHAQMFLVIDPEAVKSGESLRPGMTAIIIITQIINTIVVACAHVGMLREIQALYVRPNKIWYMYCSTSE